MNKRILILIFFIALSAFCPIYSQTDSISDWQEQILSRVDVDELSERSYQRLLEMLSALEFERRDSLLYNKVKQNIILRGDACLNIREGYHLVTAEKIEKNKAYRGDMWNQTVRYSIKTGSWSGGFTLNKDAGEAYRTPLPLGDSYSAFVTYKPSNPKLNTFSVNHAVLGHYHIKLGSGLILNQQFNMGKNLMNDVFMTSGTALSAHSSTDEYNYMQGAAAILRYRNVSIMPFFSFKNIDASLTNDTITSIPTDGYHRTKNEENKRNKSKAMDMGLHASYSSYWFEIGANIILSQFSNDYVRPIRYYNQNYFRGHRLLSGSIDYYARRYGFILRGETAIDQNTNIATISQLQHSLGEDWTVNLQYRYFGQKYQQLYAACSAESSSMQGESGTTLSLFGYPLPHWQVSAMFDYFKFSTPQYGFKDPFSGFESRVQITYSNRKSDIKLSYRLKSKESFRHSLDAVASYSPISWLTLKTQARSKIYSPKDKGGYSIGYAIGQAILFGNEDLPFKCEIQGAWFDAQEYETRLYLSERNILYGFAIPMLYGQGLRGSVTGTYRIRPNISVDLKYAIIKYLDNRDHISSGLQQIWGTMQNNLWIQLRFSL